MDNSDLDDFMDFDFDDGSVPSQPMPGNNDLDDFGFDDGLLNSQGLIDKEKRTTVMVLAGGVAALVGAVLLGRSLLSDDPEEKKGKARPGVKKQPVARTKVREPRKVIKQPKVIAQPEVAEKPKTKEKVDPYAVPDFNYSSVSTLDPLKLGVQLDRSEMIQIARSIEKAIMRGLEKIKTSFKKRKSINSTPIVKKIINDAERAVQAKIPGFNIHRVVARTETKGNTINHYVSSPEDVINQFLTYIGKYFHSGSKTVNICDLQAKYEIRNNDVGRVGYQLDLANRYIRDFANEASGIARGNVTLCFKSKSKEDAKHYSKNSNPIDKRKPLHQLEREMYESVRLHESIHAYISKKYPKFIKLKYKSKNELFRITQIEELCTQAAQLAKAQSYVAAISIGNQPSDKKNVYALGGNLFRRLYMAKIKEKIRKKELTLDPFILNMPEQAIINHTIYNAKSLDMIREIGREMFKKGITMIEAEIAALRP